MSQKIKKKRTRRTVQTVKDQVEKQTLQVFEDIDKEIEAELYRLKNEQGIIPSCQKGCFSCCKQPIAAPLPETYAISQYIKRNFNTQELEELKIRLVSWFSWVKEELPHHLANGVDEAEAFYNYGLFCPLLINDACSIYPVRPLVCRGYYVSSDPRSCLPLTDKSALKEEPDIMRTVPGVGMKHALRIRNIVERQGLNFDDAVLSLPQWLIVQMGWNK